MMAIPNQVNGEAGRKSQLCRQISMLPCRSESVHEYGRWHKVRQGARVLWGMSCGLGRGGKGMRVCARIATQFREGVRGLWEALHGSRKVRRGLGDALHGWRCTGMQEGTQEVQHGIVRMQGCVQEALCWSGRVGENVWGCRDAHNAWKGSEKVQEDVQQVQYSFRRVQGSVQETPHGLWNMHATAARVGEAVQVGKTYPSDLLSSLPASPLIFFRNQQGRLQTAITWLQALGNQL